MRLFVNGHPQVVVVDDFIPIWKESNLPCYAGKKTNNIWPMLLEKEWAKLNGSYEGIINGSVDEAMSLFLPFPNEIIKFCQTESDLENIWREISTGTQSNIDKKHIIGCSRSSEKDKDQNGKEVFNKIGLISNHSYSVTGYYNFTVGSDSYYLLKLNNPWNKQTFTGAWSDSDVRWTDTIKKHVGFNDKAGGEFYININTFMTFFDSISVCKINTSLKESTIKMSHKKGEYCLAAVKVKSPNSKLILRVRQQTSRFFPESTGYKAAFSRILVGRKTGDSSRPIEYVINDFQKITI